MSRFWPKHVRSRLTLWYVGVLAGALLLYGGSTCAVLLYQFRSQLDQLAIEDLETVEGFLMRTPDGKVELESDYHDHEYPDEMHQRLLEVRGMDGTILYRNERLANRVLAGDPEPEEGVDSYSPRSVRLPDGTRVRIVSRRHHVNGVPTLIRLGFSEEELWQRFWQVAAGLVLGLPLALGLAGLAGYFLAKRALGPLERMARRAQEIHAERLSARIDVENPDDEIGQLAQAFNGTLARLESSFDQLKRFTSDASHELRTPLTSIRSVGEVGLQKEGSAEHYRDVISSMLEEAGRLNRLVESLLTIARADAGQIPLQREMVEVLSFVQESCGLLEVLAEEKGQAVSIDGDSGVWISADRMILRQVLINLLDNAIKHSPSGASIRIRVTRQDNLIAVEIEDSGPGISSEHRERVFDRFYRIDESRSREAGGTGLGLAIAKWGAEVHGGQLELDDTTSTGSIFRLWLPLSAERARREATSTISTAQPAVLGSGTPLS